MLILAKLVFKSYMPKELEIGMWFKKDHSDVVYGKIYNYITIYELKALPRDMDEYISINGAPVEAYIIQPMKNPDDPEEILVIPKFIGWWEYDDGYEDDDGNWTENIVLEDLSPKFINEWIYGENGDNDGLIALEVNDDREAITYVDDEGNDTGKVIIKQSDYVNEEDTIEEEYLEDEGDWDDMDDEPEDEWIHDHPKDKTDHDPE
jgi:hypothetical protein